LNIYIDYAGTTTHADLRFESAVLLLVVLINQWWPEIIPVSFQPQHHAPERWFFTRTDSSVGLLGVSGDPDFGIKTGLTVLGQSVQRRRHCVEVPHSGVVRPDERADENSRDDAYFNIHKAVPSEGESGLAIGQAEVVQEQQRRKSDTPANEWCER
jgi:hypothetical protein